MTPKFVIFFAIIRKRTLGPTDVVDNATEYLIASWPFFATHRLESALSVHDGDQHQISNPKFIPESVCEFDHVATRIYTVCTVTHQLYKKHSGVVFDQGVSR
jgi:hypothetical protein